MPSPDHHAPAGLEDRLVVLTGGSDGIGRAAAIQYVERGAHVVLVGRNDAKTRAAASSIMSATGRRAIDIEVADLSHLGQVHELADRLLTRWPRIHVLANNAGAVFLDRQQTPDGIERTLALNHLAYFVLSLRLLDGLAAAAAPGAPARVLLVASRAHQAARLDLDDLQLVGRFRGYLAYANSKLCNILCATSLGERLDPSRVVAHSLHPGLVSTRFAVNNGAQGRFWRRLMDLGSVPPDQGADTLVWLSYAAEGIASSGDYWVRRARVRPSRAARDPRLAAGLWRASEQLTGLDADAMIRAAGVGRGVGAATA
jgi:NAD(P)-dependent dehydrogenase (short-subunit alcohol dehydrogenase family)